MAFKFITGPNGSDKTAKCMDMLGRCKGYYKHIYYVVPEYLSFSAEKQISATFGAVSEALVNVTSFKKLYLETVNIAGEKNYKKLTKGGMYVLMAYICLKNKNDLKMIGKAAGSAGFAETMANAIGEFKTYNVLPQDLIEASDKINDALKLKLNDIAKIYEEYNVFMEKGFSDAHDELGILLRTISDNPDIYKDSLFVFDGFNMFTPDQIGVITVLAKNSDLAFALSSDDLEGETYIAQKDSINKLRKALFDIEEKPFETAVMGEKNDSFPEGKYILDSLVYGKNNTFDGKTDKIEILEFAEQYAEAEFVAKKITELVKSGARYKDIMIVARDTERYLPVISTIFKDYEIPVFVDKKLDAANQPALNAVLSALSVLQENFSYDSVFSYLKTGFSNLNDFEIDLIENYIIATGIRGNGWMKTWEYTPYISQLFENEPDFLVKINEIREKVLTPLLKLKSGLDNNETIAGKCKVLFDFITEIGLFNKIKGMVERFKQADSQVAAYCGRVWNILINWMDEFVKILGDEKESTEVFISLFMLGLSMNEISIVPTNYDVVQVVQPENISETPEKFVFVIGANDGVYPAVMQSEGLLSDYDRMTLSELGIDLAHDTVTKAMEENYITAKTFMSAYRKLFITYPVGDTTGGARFPAVAVKRIKNTFPELAIKTEIGNAGSYSDKDIIKPKPAFSKFAANLRSDEPMSDMWKQVGNWYREDDEWRDKYNMLEKAFGFSPETKNLDETVTDMLYRNGLNLSVSSMEKYSNCPFAYYANYTLRLKTREKADFSVADSGTMMHEAIEKLSCSIVKNGYNWKTAPQSFLDKETVRIVDGMIIELEGKFDKSSAAHSRHLARIKEMIEQSVKYISEHLKAGKFEPIGYEIEFGTGKNYEAVSFEVGGKKIRLRGMVDRADVYCDEQGRKYLRVIDYKSGDKSFDFSALLYGLQMQLVLYLDRLCEETGASPAGILYFRLFDPVVDANQNLSDKEINDLIEKQHKMTGVVVDNEDVIKAMDSNFTSDSKIIPVKLKADGELDKRSSVITSSQFADMQKHINRLVKKVGKDILNGKNEIKPIHYGTKTGCDYCDFKQICLFDEHCGGKFRELESIKKEEVLSLIKKAGEDDED